MEHNSPSQSRRTSHATTTSSARTTWSRVTRTRCRRCGSISRAPLPSRVPAAPTAPTPSTKAPKPWRCPPPRPVDLRACTSAGLSASGVRRSECEGLIYPWATLTSRRTPRGPSTQQWRGTSFLRGRSIFPGKRRSPRCWPRYRRRRRWLHCADLDARRCRKSKPTRRDQFCGASGACEISPRTRTSSRHGSSSRGGRRARTRNSRG
mmetsp:Transcript_10195/g.29891  ORF Transcript_10195/g.29891 Transcript_10195/m.29891 type:complete len:207 (+) Transcript_10195:493-1113(+)